MSVLEVAWTEHRGECDQCASGEGPYCRAGGLLVAALPGAPISDDKRRAIDDLGRLLVAHLGPSSYWRRRLESNLRRSNRKAQWGTYIAWDGSQRRERMVRRFVTWGPIGRANRRARRA